jgi:hypothetical protein
MNKLSQPELWEKIQNFNFDDQNSSYPFSKKLATENNWSEFFTLKAIAEYRKFIFLCCISPTGASPSDTVDKVWHLHLTYTKNYWEDFCRKTLQQDIHHHPSKGGTEEKTKHGNWYSETLSMYETVFKTKPPADIWPPGAAAEPEAITGDIYDKKFLQQFVLIFLSAMALLIFLINPYRSKGAEFLEFYLTVAVGGIIVTLILQQNKSARLQEMVFANLPAGFTLYQITHFLQGPHRCYQTALVDLLKRGIIETTGIGYTIIELPASLLETEKNPLLSSLISNYRNGNKFTYLEGYALMDFEAVQHPAFEKLLQLSKKVDYPKLVIPGIVLLTGFTRLTQGIANEKPVEYLVVTMAVFGMITLAILQSYSYTYMVKKLVHEFWERQNADGKGDDVLGNFSILGTAAIAGFAEYSFLTSDFSFYEPQNKRWTGGEYSSTSSCGSGDGGGGCGGGGCGGCSS